jgi:putative ABC transport system substrate-binding protein
MLGVGLHFREWRTAAEIEPVFAALQQARIDAVVGFADQLTFTNRNAIAGLALKHRLPLMFELREFVDAGALMAYGVNLTWAYQRAAVYVDRIFKGARPADLPVEQPTTFELIINLKTAKALGLTIPQTLLLRADHVIQ